MINRDITNIKLSTKPFLPSHMHKSTQLIQKHRDLMPWYLSKWFGCHLWGAVIDNRVSLWLWWPRSLAWEHKLTHKNISYFPRTSALGVFLTRQHCQWGNGGSGTVIHIIWISLWFLTFGPHNKSSVGYHCRENGETETVVNKLHVFKHTHCNVLMNSHSHVKT